MRAWALPYKFRGLSRTLPFLVAVLSVASWGPRANAAEQLPDVVVTALVLAPSTARAGDPVTATVTLRNQGGGPAGASVSNLHLGNSDGTLLTGIPPLGTLAFDTLPPGSSQQVSSSFVVPSVPAGSFSVIAVADGAALLAESSETNNRRTASLRVTIPDLTVPRLTLTPSRARAGDTVTATVIIVNLGPVPADATAVHLNFETAPGVPPTGVGSVVAGPLAARESREVSFAFTVPAVPSRRSYRVRAQIDPDGYLLETNEGNNRRDVWLQVAVPDLSVEGLSMTPNPARAGDAITVALRVRNRGPVPANASQANLYVATRFSTSLAGMSALTTRDVPLLAPGKEASLVFTMTLPVLPSAHYQLITVVDDGGAQTESSKTNNRRATSFEVAVPVVTIDALDLVPSLVRAGQSATANVRISNRGRVSSRPTTSDVFVAASDTAPFPGSTSAGTLSVSSLKPGASVSFPVPVTVPLVDPGAHYVIAQVDASTAAGGWTTPVASGAATSPSPSLPRKATRFTVAGLPDLIVSELSSGSTVLHPGANMAVVLTVKNVGSTVAASTLTGLLFGACSGSGMATIKTVSVPSLAPGASARSTVTAPVPPVDVGSYCVAARADTAGDLEEAIEANNEKTVPVSVATTSVTLVPHVDPGQSDVPWPKHSHYKQPWRAWLETVPTRHFLDGVGLSYGWFTARRSHAVSMRFVAESGFARIRTEVPWGAIDYDTLELNPDAKRHLTDIVTVAKAHGIRPLILLNAHHGVGVPARELVRSVTSAAPRGSRTVVLNDVSGIATNYTGLSNLTEYHMAEVIITAVNPTTRTVTLSKPLPVALGAGAPVTLHTMRYLPLFEPGMPEYEATVDGWVAYARAVARAVCDAGVTEFDMEIWNELTFGSRFLSINDYYDPPVVQQRTSPYERGGRIWDFGRSAIEMLAAEFPGVHSIWGFSNTWFFMNDVSALPTGTKGQSYHPYHPLYQGPDDEQDGTPDNINMEGYAPHYRAFFPEHWGTYVWTEALTRRINPDERLKRPPGSPEFGHYITEYGFNPHDVGVSDESHGRDIKARVMLRSAFFWLNKGIRALWFHTDIDEGGFGLVHPDVADLPDYPANPTASFTPAMTALRNARDFLGGASFSGPTRQLDVELAAADGEGGGTIFHGDGTHPSLTYQDVLAVLPFQSDERAFVLALYVMTRDVVDTIEPVQFVLKIKNVKGETASIDYQDPLNGAPVPVAIVSRDVNSITLSVPVADYPYLLRLRE